MHILNLKYIYTNNNQFTVSVTMRKNRNNDEVIHEIISFQLICNINQYIGHVTIINKDAMEDKKKYFLWPVALT